MKIQELIDVSVEPLKDMENGFYKVLVPSNSKDRSYRWRRYIIIFCNNCNNICAKKYATSTKYDYIHYCNYRCYQNKNMIRELIHNGKLYTINDIPKKYRNQGLNPIQKWIDENKSNKEYMRKYINLPCSQVKRKAYRKQEWKKIKNNPILLKENRIKKSLWAKTERGKACSKRYRNKSESKIKSQIYKSNYYKNNQILWRIRTFMRNIHNDSKINKVNSWIEYGINIKLIKEHLVKKATLLGGYDKVRHNYHIDHIIPISLYDINDIEEIKKCNHPLNLRWLPAKENISRGNKIRPQDLEVIKTLPENIYPKGTAQNSLAVFHAVVNRISAIAEYYKL